VGIFAISDIKAHEELTIDYQVSFYIISNKIHVSLLLVLWIERRSEGHVQMWRKEMQGIHRQVCEFTF